MTDRPRKTKREKVLRLACTNAERLRGAKVELEHFLNQYGVDICFLSETFRNPAQDFRLANYVSHRTDKQTAGGSTPIPVRRGIVHHSVPVLGLTRMEATAGRQVKILAA